MFSCFSLLRNVLNIDGVANVMHALCLVLEKEMFY